eukprot:jgi/Mesvir1/24296/Mv10990-RA.2
MFKKPSPVHSSHRLSGADKKKLRHRIKDLFNASDEAVDTVFPSKADFTTSKLANRAVLYAAEGCPPVLFDSSGKGDYYPTVFCLWQVPSLLPSLMLKHPDVSKFILHGSDLMLPGILVPPEGLPQFGEGEIWSVVIPGNPAPIAVGVTLLSSAAAMASGMRGKVLKVVHYYGDKLWESAPGKPVPNAGFLADRVTAIDGRKYEDVDALDFDAEGGEDGAEEGAHAAAEGEDCPGSAVGGADEGRVATSGESAAEAGLAAELGDMRVADESNNHGQGGAETEEAEEADAGASAPASLSPAEMDQLVESCFLQALHKSVKDGDMPILGSALWAQHILPCRAPGTKLDIKKTTYKKLSVLLKKLDKDGLISTKEDKHKKETAVTKVHRNHEAYRAYVPYGAMEKDAASGSGGGSAGSGLSSDAGGAGSADASSGGAHSGPIKVDLLYKITPAVKPIFAAVGAGGGGGDTLLTAAEAAAVVHTYIEKEKLLRPEGGGTIELDAILCDALYKGAVKKGAAYPTHIHKSAVDAAFLARMQANHRITRGSETTVRKGTIAFIYWKSWFFIGSTLTGK